METVVQAAGDAMEANSKTSPENISQLQDGATPSTVQSLPQDGPTPSLSPPKSEESKDTAQPTAADEQPVPETPVRKAGLAAIKKEFLLVNYKPSLQSEYVSDEMKSKMAAANKESTAVKEGEDKQEESDDGGSEPPNKKPKLKGRNKQRPRNEKLLDKERICPAVKEERSCPFAEKCKFNHDKADFMANKLPDLKGSCHVFDTFGYCQFGITCRFSKNHLSDDFQNLVKEGADESVKSKRKVINELDKDVRAKLWKKKYDFKRSDAAEKEVAKNFRGWGNTGGPEETETVANPTNTASVDAGSVPATADGNATQVGGGVTDEEVIRLRPEEKTKIDLKNKLYLAPLTTVGNLPFRRVCKGYGAEVTCGEMALVTQVLKAKASEWSLMKRHPSEDIFGVQICGSYPDTMTRCAQLLTETCDIDFIDINCGCPIDLIYNKGLGSAMMAKATKLEQVCRSMLSVMGNTALTVKLRTGVFDDRNVAHQIIPRLRDAGVSLVTVHGRSRQQRYTRQADWDYISQCAAAGAPMPVFGNGDILSWEDANLHMKTHGVSGVMLARGALIKPWLFTEIREQRHWDISSGERFDMLRDFTNYGLEQWGSDLQGVENTRKFLLEWLSFLHRYIPVGVLERVPQRINERPPYYVGRNDLETLMASGNCADWIKISEMLLGPVPPTFKFLPKHKANAYQ